MKKYFRWQYWSLLLLIKKNALVYWWHAVLPRKTAGHTPALAAGPPLDEYADDQIRALMGAVKAYKKAKKDPVAFVEQYFSAQILPREHRDSWTKDLVVAGPIGEFYWSGKSEGKQ